MNLPEVRSPWLTAPFPGPPEATSGPAGSALAAQSAEFINENGSCIGIYEYSNILRNSTGSYRRIPSILRYRAVFWCHV